MVVPRQGREEVLVDLREAHPGATRIMKLARVSLVAQVGSRDRGQGPSLPQVPEQSTNSASSTTTSLELVQPTVGTCSPGFRRTVHGTHVSHYG